MDGRLDSENADSESRTARRRLPPKERRAQIVDEAVRFFAEVGLEGNTRQLAKRLGVTQSLLFNYFATKDELLEAVYEKVYLDRLSPDWPDRLTDRTTPLRSRLLAFYTEYSGLIFERDWMRIFMSSGLAGAVLGPERIMFSSDYPYRFTPMGGARHFLEHADLSNADRMAIAHGNWERMVAGIRRT